MNLVDLEPLRVVQVDQPRVGAEPVGDGERSRLLGKRVETCGLRATRKRHRSSIAQLPGNARPVSGAVKNVLTLLELLQHGGRTNIDALQGGAERGRALAEHGKD